MPGSVGSLLLLLEVRMDKCTHVISVVECCCPGAHVWKYSVSPDLHTSPQVAPCRRSTSDLRGRLLIEQLWAAKQATCSRLSTVSQATAS